MKFISAQPDNQYFLWQLKVQMSNFMELGIEKDAIIVIGWRGNVSKEARDFQNQTEALVLFIEDKREEFPYIPSIRPHILKHVDLFRHNDILYHDSDILFNRIPKLNGTAAVSEADYISSDYIKEKSPELFIRMCNVVDIDPELVESHGKKVGGAQYWFPRLPIGFEFWDKVETDSINLYNLMISTSKQYSPVHPIQAWTADMWSVLWNLWLFGIDTKVDPELDFCWPMDTIQNLEKKSIFHLAGVTESDRNKHFFKGDFVNKSPFGVKLNCDETRAYSKYVNQIKKAEKIFY